MECLIQKAALKYVYILSDKEYCYAIKIGWRFKAKLYIAVSAMWLIDFLIIKFCDSPCYQCLKYTQPDYICVQYVFRISRDRHWSQMSFVLKARHVTFPLEESIDIQILLTKHAGFNNWAKHASSRPK